MSVFLFRALAKHRSHVSKDKHDARQIAHLQSRTRSGVKVDHAHRPQAVRHEGEDRRGKDHLFLSNAKDPQHMKAVLNRLESEAAFSAMSVNRVEARLVGACEAFRPTDRTRLTKTRAVRNRVCNTPKASNVNAERIEQASQKVEKQFLTSRSWFEGVSVERVCKVMPDTVRNCAWQITPALARPGRAKQNEASRRHNGQVSEFTKMNCSTEPQEDGEWSLRRWRDTVMVPSGHWRGTLARVRRYRLIWRCPENQRWDRKPLTEMNSELWNTSPRQEEKQQSKDRECIALKHLIKCGGQNGSMTSCEHAESNLRDLRARTQGIVDNEVVQTDNQRKFERHTRKPTGQFEQGTVFSWNFGRVFEGRDPQMCTFGVLGLSCETPAASGGERKNDSDEGRGVGRQHRIELLEEEERERTTPIVAFNYGFLDTGDADTFQILICRNSDMLWTEKSHSHTPCHFWFGSSKIQTFVETFWSATIDKAQKHSNMWWYTRPVSTSATFDIGQFSTSANLTLANVDNHMFKHFLRSCTKEVLFLFIANYFSWSRQIRIGHVSAFSCVKKQWSKEQFISRLFSKSRRPKQHSNSCKQHVLKSHVLVFFCSLESLDSSWLWEFMLPRIPHLLRYPFSHLHEIHQFFRCYKQLMLHLDSELLDLRAHCSVILVSRLLTVLRAIMIKITCRFHFSYQLKMLSKWTGMRSFFSPFSFPDEFSSVITSKVNFLLSSARFFLQHCRTPFVHRKSSPFRSIGFRRIPGIAKLHHQESIHHWQSDGIFHLLFFLDQSSMGVCSLELLCPSSFSPIWTASDYLWHWHPDLQDELAEV